MSEKQENSEQLDTLSNTPEISWVVVARVTVLSVALLSASICTFFYGFVSAERIRFIYTPIACLFAYCAVCAIWLRFRKPGTIFVYSQLLVDVAVITGVIYVTGGPASPFLFLYLPLIMSASIFLTRTTALIVAGLSSIAYSTLAWAMMRGLVSPADTLMNEGALVHVPNWGNLFAVCRSYLGHDSDCNRH